MSKNIKSKHTYKKPFSKKFSKERVLEMQNSRIIQKNLVHIIGISEKLCDIELLSKKEYLGQYGNIISVIVNLSNAFDLNSKRGPSYSAFVSYSSTQEAALAILSLDNFFIHGHVIRAAFGTNKYCVHFLRDSPCLVDNCMYLHKIADPKDLLNKQTEGISKTKFYDHNQLKAVNIIEALPSINKAKIFGGKYSVPKAIFPSVSSAVIKCKIAKYKENINITSHISCNSLLEMKNSKLTFSKSKQYKTEELISKELYFSGVSGNSLDISTDLNSGQIESTLNIYEIKENSRFHKGIPDDSIITRDISEYVSTLCSTYYNLRLVDITPARNIFKDTVSQEWFEEILQINCKTPFEPLYKYK